MKFDRDDQEIDPQPQLKIVSKHPHKKSECSHDEAPKDDTLIVQSQEKSQSRSLEDQYQLSAAHLLDTADREGQSPAQAAYPISSIQRNEPQLKIMNLINQQPGKKKKQTNVLRIMNENSSILYSEDAESS